MLVEWFVSTHLAFRTGFAKNYIWLGLWLLPTSMDVVCEMPGCQLCALPWYFWNARALRLDSGFRGGDSDFCTGMSHLKELLWSWSSPCRQSQSDKQKYFCNFIIQREVGGVRALNASFSCPAQLLCFRSRVWEASEETDKKVIVCNHFHWVGYFNHWCEMKYTEWYKP